ncbi:MAG: hypothetical protein EOP42_23565 [Sphingobacteriaceae bacterium]|nr:MAG: hypothetical protein EOP42_23565 [Sphingobacteriaceae bacterium]
MKLLDRLKGLYSLLKRQPEDDYVVLISDDCVQVNHPWWGNKIIKWTDIEQVLLVNTDQGPWFPDVWLTLVGCNGSFKIPLGAKGYEEIYAVVSNYEGFNFENVIESMSCTERATFILWDKNNPEI